MTNINNQKEEKKEPKKLTRAQKGMIVLAAVGVGMEVYGWTRGRVSGYKDGYRRGFIEGEVHANKQFHELANRMIQAIEKTKGD